MKRKYLIYADQRLAGPSRAAFHSVASEQDIAGAGTPKPAKEYVDFSFVPERQADIHDRLENWARSSRGGDKQSGEAAPMFRLHKSDEWEQRKYGAETIVPVDRADALRVSRGVIALPDKNRAAIQWFYVMRGRHPLGKARELAVTLAGLALLVLDGRTMLVNRGV